MCSFTKEMGMRSIFLKPLAAKPKQKEERKRKSKKKKSRQMLSEREEQERREKSQAQTSKVIGWCSSVCVLPVFALPYQCGHWPSIIQL